MFGVYCSCGCLEVTGREQEGLSGGTETGGQNRAALHRPDGRDHTGCTGDQHKHRVRDAGEFPRGDPVSVKKTAPILQRKRLSAFELARMR